MERDAVLLLSILVDGRWNTVVVRRMDRSIFHLFLSGYKLERRRDENENLVAKLSWLEQELNGGVWGN